MANLTKHKVNADGFVYTVPSPVKDQAPVPRSAYRGEIIELDEDQARRGRELKINRDYQFGTLTVRRVEPALVDVDYDTDVAAADAARAARVDQLKAELAALDAVPATPAVATDETPAPAAAASPPAAPAAPPAPPAPPAARASGAKKSASSG